MAKRHIAQFACKIALGPTCIIELLALRLQCPLVSLVNLSFEERGSCDPQAAPLVLSISIVHNQCSTSGQYTMSAKPCQGASEVHFADRFREDFGHHAARRVTMQMIGAHLPECAYEL